MNGDVERGVRREAVDPNVNVAGRARDTVHGECVRADDQKPSLGREQCRQEVDEVGVHDASTVGRAFAHRERRPQRTHAHGRLGTCIRRHGTPRDCP